MRAKIENRLREFKSYLVQIGYKPRTVYMVYECVKDFWEYHTGIATEELTTVHINQFYDWLQVRPNKLYGGGLSEQYIHHHVYALKVFFNWQETTNQIQYNPISVMKFKSPKGNPREPLTREEITQLFEAAETIKETAVLHLFYSCGLRRSEGEALNIKDVHIKQKLLYVRKGKGAKRRVVPMTEKVSRDLQNYLEETTHDQEYFMLNKIGNRMSGDSYNRVLKAILKRSELNPETSLHHLRHSIATHLLESGLTVEYVRDFLGHAHLESTQIYVKIKSHQLKNL